MKVEKSALLSFIKSHGSVNFEEIEAFFERKKYKYRGDTVIRLSQSRLVVWNGWNRQASEVFMELVAEKSVILDSVSMAQAPMPPAFRGLKLLSEMEYIPVIVRAARKG